MEDIERTNILVFAHRGASKEFPENTFPSFRKAVELGADYIETDIHFTRDNNFAVIHDDSIDRMTEGSGLVSSYTMDELKEFDAGYFFTSDGGETYPFRDKGIRIMSIGEMLEAFPDQKFNIDLKEKTPLQVKYFIDIIKRYNAEDRIIAASEHFGNLRALRKISSIATSFSTIEASFFLFLYKCGLLFLNFSFKGIALQIPENLGQFKIVTGAFVKEAHAAGLDIHVWTINHEQDMRRLIEIGVDGIMSDDPELLIKVLGEEKAGNNK